MRDYHQKATGLRNPSESVWSSKIYIHDSTGSSESFRSFRDLQVLYFKFYVIYGTNLN